MKPSEVFEVLRDCEFVLKSDFSEADKETLLAYRIAGVNPITTPQRIVEIVQRRYPNTRNNYAKARKAQGKQEQAEVVAEAAQEATGPTEGQQEQTQGDKPSGNRKSSPKRSRKAASTA